MANRIICDEGMHDALLTLFAQFARFGETAEGGVARLAASKSDGAARDHLCGWLRGNGFKVVIDAVGNIFGILDLGQGDAGLHFYCGSHLDSQPHGGRFDGTLGVVCACIAALTIRRGVGAGWLTPTFRQLVVACWTGEEGARFQPSLLGSGVFSGSLDTAKALAIRDENGISLRDALAEIGYLGTEKPPRPAHYIELHIEQGTRLEMSGTAIGIVTACWGARKLRIEIDGRPDHTGPTPMAERRDALLAAAKVVVQANKHAVGATSLVHSSVGRMTISPNSPNTVVAHVDLWAEFRAGDENALSEVEEGLTLDLVRIEQDTGCGIRVGSREVRNVVTLDSAAADCVAGALDRAGISHMQLATIAGHDAVRLQSVCPATLIFVPSRGGISHAPGEFTSDAHLLLGFDAMVLAMAELISTPVIAPGPRAQNV
jgi:N-carbamoyl-L-amino-acid hydrolase